MPEEFIYRRKSGFVPPFAEWLRDPAFNGRVREEILRKSGHVCSIVPERIFSDLLDDALEGRTLRFPVLNFLWGSLFTEMWLKAHITD